MAVALVAGLVSVGGAIIANAGINLFVAFAIGAGLSMVSRALMPSPDLGSQMSGRSVTSRDAAHSRKIVYGRARIGGNLVYLESSGADKKYLWLVIVVAGHEIDAYEEVWFNDIKIWDGGSFVGDWGSYVSIGFHKGDQTTADSALVAASSKWTSDHKLLDTAYMAIQLTYDVDKFANGLPNISTVLRGKKVLNPATSTTAWSQNPALCIYDYLRDTKYGLGESAGNILTSSINAAATVCDETVALAAGGTQNRYTMDGVVDTASSIKSNIDSMLGAMIGRLVFSSGKFEIHAGEYLTPNYTVDESVAVGEISIQTKQSRRNAYNGVKGVFLSEDDNYILADYPAQLSKTTAGSFVTGERYKILTIDGTDFTAIGASANTVGLNFTATGAGSGSGTASLFLAEDNEQIYLDMPLPFTVNNVRAQRIAKLALFRSRQQEAITIPCNLSALRFKIGDNINVTNARLGYSNKVFEVVGYNMDFTSEGQIVVNVDAIETAPSIWDWTTSDEEVYLGAGEVELYDGLTAAAPTSLNITGDSFLNSDGTFNTSFNVAWTDADDAFTDHYVVEWKKTSDSNYFTMDSKASPAVITGLQNNQQYNVRVKAVNEIGVSSTYIVAAPTAAVDTTAPDAPSPVSASGQYQHISISWTNPTQKDLSHIDVYRSTSSGGTYTLIGNTDGTVFIDDDLANSATFYYKVKAIDFTGNASAFSLVANSTTSVVGSGDIGSGAVDTDQISDLAVETDKIDDDAVTISKIATSLESTNYLAGSAGWKIQKSGVVEFEQATIRGDVSATSGSIASSVTIGGTTASTVVSGAADGATAIQDSDTNVDLGLTGGTISGITISATKLYEGAGTFNNSNTGFYLDNTGQFSLKDKLSFNGTTLSVSGDIVADNLNVTNANVTGSFVANNLPTLQNMNGVITVNQINADTITVDKLSGDVSELYPASIYENITATSSTQFGQNFAIPAPSLSISKRQRLDLDFDFTTANSSGTDHQVQFTLNMQRKSKGATGTAVGTVTLASGAPPFNQWVYIGGNKLALLDNTGGVADNSSGSGTTGNINSVYYDSGNNRTYVMVSSSSAVFSNGETMYFSPSKFASAGTWISADYGIDSNIFVPTGKTVNVRIPFSNTYGESTTATEFRPSIVGTTNISNVTCRLVKWVGTMENVS